MHQVQPPLTHKLRWRFDYADGRVSKYGTWDSGKEGEASFTTKTSLRRAAIESIDMMGHIRTVAECDGYEFVNFEWLAQRRTSTSGLIFTAITGLRIRTRDSMADVYKSGEITTRPRERAELSFHYAGFGR